jgi:NitT/TauT family transport system substrate-binding protein
LNEIYGRMVFAINVSYPEKLSSRPTAFAEFNRMFKDSVAYALNNRAEVFAAVGKQANIDSNFFDWWFDKTTEIPAEFTDVHAMSLGIAWDMAKRYGLIDSIPKMEPLIWKPS